MASAVRLTTAGRGSGIVTRSKITRTRGGVLSRLAGLVHHKEALEKLIAALGDRQSALQEQVLKVDKEIQSLEVAALLSAQTPGEDDASARTSRGCARRRPLARGQQRSEARVWQY